MGISVLFSLLALAAPTAHERHVVGHSVFGRPIVAVESGNPFSAERVLVVGCIHGNETAGTAVTRRLLALAPPRRVDLWILPNLNPDGRAVGVRQNGRGVDLNRNFSAGWRPNGVRWDPTYPGPRPFSEPETRIARALIRQVRPTIAIWFHQPQAVVRGWGESIPTARRYARLAGVPYRTLPAPNGAATRWQSRHFPGTSAFVVELPPGRLARRAVRRYAAAVLSLTASDLARWAPASSMARNARSESPGSTSTPRTASSTTVTSKPSSSASRTLFFTQ
jgi:murein peptide amidase A